MYNIIPYLSFIFTIVIFFKRSDNVVFLPYILFNVPSVDVSIGIPLSNIEVHIVCVLIKRTKFETNTYVICVSVWSIPYCTFCFLNCLFTYINNVLIQPYFKAKHELMIYIEECSLWIHNEFNLWINILNHRGCFLLLW